MFIREMTFKYLFERAYPLLLALLFCASAWLYGAVCYPMLNADHAIHVMMAKQFDVSHSLYYWGQDRLGSLLPALTWPLAQIMAPIWAITILQVGVLFAVWFCWSRWLQSLFNRLLLAGVLWFPPLAFDPLVAIGQPYALMLLLWGGAFLLQRKGTMHPGRTAWSFFLLGMAVYVSEGAVVALPVFMGWLLWRIFKQHPTDWWRKAALQLLSGLAAMAPIVLLILAAKKNSTRIPLYGQKPLSTPVEVLEFVQRMWQQFADGMSEASLWTSPYVWAQALALILLVSIPFTPYLWRKCSDFRRAETVVLGALFGGYFALVLVANWPASVPHAERFFAPLYFLGPLYLLFLSESRIKKELNQFFRIQILVMALLFGLRSAWLILGPPPVFSDRLSIGDAREFPVEKGATYIGNYWNVYLLGAFAPEGVQYVPYEGDYVRHREFLHRAFQGENIYLIANHWLDDFPVQIRQHGHFLERVGEPMKHQGYHYCLYRQLSD